MNLPWKFFQAATLVSSRTFKKERPGGTHKDKSTGMRLKWFSFAVKKKKKLFLIHLIRSMQLTFGTDADEQLDPQRNAMW